MESKIERLEEFNWFEGRDALTIALDNTIIKKLNQVIDHLNSQDQEEEKPVSFTDALVEMDRIENMTEEEYNEEVEDTPEEWEKGIRELLLQLTSPLKPTQLAIEEGAKSDEQRINEIIELVFKELDKVKEDEFEKGVIKGRLEALPITIEEVNKAREEGRKDILKSFRSYKDEYIKHIWKGGIPDSLIEDILENVEEMLKELILETKEDEK